MTYIEVPIEDRVDRTGLLELRQSPKKNGPCLFADQMPQVPNLNLYLIPN